MALPTAAFNTAKSIFAGKTIVSVKIGGSSTAIIFESKMLDHQLDQEFKEIQRPDANGVLRTVRKVLVKQTESFKFEVDEAKRVVTDIFNGSLAGSAVAKAQVWTPDPADATGKVALQSEADFDCTLERDGNMKFGDSDFTKATIKLTSLKTSGPVTFTSDATIS